VVLGRALIALGLILLLAGIWITLGWRLPFRIGRLPGDIFVRRGPVTFYFPIVTCIVVSVILTVLVSLFRR
jgi:hypothetical protein